MKLPEDLKQKSVTLGGEVAWGISDAREVIERVGQMGLAIVGVEIWLSKEDSPVVWGWSDYRIDFQGDWELFVRENNACALRELMKPVPENAVVNLTWVSRREMAAKQNT